MKQLILTLFTVLAIGAFGQKIADATYTDCNGNTEGVYATLVSGKVLVIASKGFDCGICKSHAVNYENFISQNSATIAGWGAMVNLYSQSTPTCANMTSWRNAYGWNNIFSFLDLNDDYFMSGTPRYYVVNPADSTIVYSGGNFNTMQQTALQYASSISIEEQGYFFDLKVFKQNESIAVQTSLNLEENTKIELYNIAGQIEKVWNKIEQGQSGYQLDLNKTLNSGVYLLRISSNGQVVTKKLVWAN